MNRKYFCEEFFGHQKRESLVDEVVYVFCLSCVAETSQAGKLSNDEDV